MRQALLFVVLLGLGASPALAQEFEISPAGPRTGTGMILGRVVDAETGRPIRGAIVQIEGHDESGTTTLTDGDGRFVYGRLPSGWIGFVVAKGGYHNAQHGQRRPNDNAQSLILKEGERRGDVVIRMWKYSAITGTVRDEAGEPVVGVPVQVFARRFVAGQARLVLQRDLEATTDDRGVYRLPRLEPGSYVVAVQLTETAVPRSVLDAYKDIPAADKAGQMEFYAALSAAGMTHMAPGASGRVIGVGDFVRGFAAGAIAPPPSGKDGSLFSYPTVYYPNVRSDGDAQPVSLRAGDERTGIDFTLTPVRTVRVSGIIDAAGFSAANRAVHLLPLAADGSVGQHPVARTMTDARGAFTFLGVPAGEYRIHLLKPPASSHEEMGFFEAVGFSSTSGSVTLSEETFTLAPKPAKSGETPEPAVLWASTRVLVADRDISGVSVPVRPGLRVTGTVVLDGVSSDAAADLFKQIGATFAPADGRRLPATVGWDGHGEGAGAVALEVEKDGTFQTMLPPGAYVIRAGDVEFPDFVLREVMSRMDAAGSVGGLGSISIELSGMSSATDTWTLQAVHLQGRDVTDAGFTVTDQDLSDLVLTFTRRSTTISGAVRATSGAADPDATVVLFPTDPTLWANYGADNSWRVRRVRTGPDGAYAFQRVPAGEYLVAAVRDDDRSPSPDPEWLGRIARGATRVTIALGETRTLPLQVITIK